MPTDDEPLSDQTALAVAISGVICPVPFLMPAAAMRMTSSRRSRKAKVAFWLGALTILAQAVGIVLLILWLT